MRIQVRWPQSGSCSALARVTAREATGAWTNVAGESRWIKQVDVESIAYRVFDLDAEDPDAPLDDDVSLDAADVIIDTPVTNRHDWDADRIGFNFAHDLPSTLFAIGGHRYLVQYEITLTALAGSAKFFVEFSGPADPIAGD